MKASPAAPPDNDEWNDNWNTKVDKNYDQEVDSPETMNGSRETMTNFREADVVEGANDLNGNEEGVSEIASTHNKKHHKDDTKAKGKDHKHHEGKADQEHKHHH